MAALGLGLIGDPQAREPLVAALTDPSSVLVQGSAAEALGLIGDRGAADAIGRMLAQLVDSGAVSEWPAEADETKRDTPSAAFRRGVVALVRLKAYDALAGAVLDGAGQPRVRGWPVAFALQRIEDKRALPALMTLAGDSNPYTRTFAIKGLGALKDRMALPILLPLLKNANRLLAIEAIRAAGRIGDSSAADPLIDIALDAKADPQARFEAVTAVAALPRPPSAAVVDALLDLITDRDPTVRGAALQAMAALDPDGFVAALSSLDADSNWKVRAALATALSGLNAEIGLPRLRTMLGDSDQRVVPSVLSALVKLAPAEATTMLLERLKAEDPAVRAEAARAIGELKPAGAGPSLAAAFQLAERDATYIARAAALEALAAYGATSAMPSLQTALGDKDWAVRVRAAALVKQLDPNGAGATVDAAIRPAPTTVPAETYQAARIVTPPVSTHAFIETERGSIEIELAVLDAPLTVENFVSLARKGFFNGLTFHRVVPGLVIQGGDPRGDGEGGANYTIRDELNEQPYLRGTVGMALDWADTGSSQFFITQTPQPHLDAKYTAFGRVTAGMDIVDRIQAGDVIRQVRIWDGVQAPSGGAR